MKYINFVQNLKLYLSIILYLLLGVFKFSKINSKTMFLYIKHIKDIFIL